MSPSGPRPETEGDGPLSYFDEAAAAERRMAGAYLVRLSVAFVLLFAFVFFCLWWSGAAIRFGAARIAKPTPTWRVTGTVRNAATHEPVPWAVVEDDPAGRPPYYRCDAGAKGDFALLTLAEPHRLRISASGYQARTVPVGRYWFIWWPHGQEVNDIDLIPE